MSQVGIVLSNDGGKVYGSGLISVVNGGWSITVSPALVVGQYTINVYDANNNKLTSDYLNVSSGSTQASITVLSPNGGETLTIGQLYTISWRSSSPGADQPVEIDLERKTPTDSQFWNIGTISTSQQGSESYQWKVSANDTTGRYVNGAQYKILIGKNMASGIGPVDESNSYFTITSSSTTARPPVISGGTFPTKLNVSETGMWSVNASDPQNGSLSYSVNWGDYSAGYAGVSALGINYVQTSTFTHSYQNPGKYTVTFTVKNSAGLTAQTSATVQVVGAVQPIITAAVAPVVSSQFVSPNIPNQNLGGFTVTVSNEPIIVKNMVFVLGSKPMNTTPVTGITLVDENGRVVAGPVDSTATSDNNRGTYINAQKFIFPGPVNFPMGTHTYFVKGKIPAAFANQTVLTVATNPVFGWTNAVGQTSGNQVNLSGVASVYMNPVTVVLPAGTY
ncbi:MAG: PKD domain-containing protein [Patescibacteria group bacterium]